MADYNEILDAELEPEKPVTSSLMTRLRDNAIAIAEGAAGAPRVVLDPDTVDTANIVNDAVTAAKLAETANEVSWVLGRTADADAGLLGTYALLIVSDGSVTNLVGTVRAGSDLEYASAAGDTSVGNNPPTGTWRCMGTTTTGGNASATTLWLRVS